MVRVAPKDLEFEVHKDGNKFSLHFQIDSSKPHFTIIFEQQCIIIKKLVYNAIDRSECSKIWITGEISSNSISISIKHDGKCMNYESAFSQDEYQELRGRVDRIRASLSFINEPGEECSAVFSWRAK